MADDRRAPSWGYRVSLALLTLLGVGGIWSLGLLMASGPEPYLKWGYTAATLAFLLGTAQAAPLAALSIRLTHGSWGVPALRAAELFGLAGLVTAPLGIVLLLQLPAWQGRPSIWSDWPGAPQLWDGIGLVLLAGCGLALLILSARPDRPRWVGTPNRWRVQRVGLMLIGALYALSYVLVQTLVSSDLAMSLVPGWASAVQPPYHVISGYLGGLAVTVLALGALRRWAGAVVPDGVFHHLGTVLLAASLLWFYFAWSEFLTFWYGNSPREQALLALPLFEPSSVVSLAALLGCSLLPFLLLMWNGVRHSVAGPMAAAGLVVVGMLFDRIRLYVTAWSVAGPVQAGAEHVPPVPPLQLPGPLDAMVMVGLSALVGLVYLAALRIVPPVSGWESRAVAVLRSEERVGRTRVAVLARPGER